MLELAGGEGVRELRSSTGGEGVIDIRRLSRRRELRSSGGWRGGSGESSGQP